jgi:hypothetical protein
MIVTFNDKTGFVDAYRLLAISQLLICQVSTVWLFTILVAIVFSWCYCHHVSKKMHQ